LSFLLRDKSQDNCALGARSWTVRGPFVPTERPFSGNKGESKDGTTSIPNTHPIILPMAGSQLSHFHPHVSLSRLRAYVRILFYPKTPLEGASPPSHPIDVPAPADLSIPELLPTDPAASCALLYELASHLRSWLPYCRWLEEGTIEFVGNHPVDAGEFANIYLGMRGNRKVIIKCYRFYPSSDYFPTYMVGT